MHSKGQRRLIPAAAGVIAVLTLSACGSVEPMSSGQEPTRRSSPGASETPATASSPSSGATSTGLPDPCLLSVKEVSQALAGSWSVSKQSNVSCVYHSDRGAIFAIQNVMEPDPEGGLTSARSSCDSKPREVRRTDSFACVEHKDDGDMVVGNIIAHDNLWVLVILASGGGQHHAELDAMRALLGQVRA